MKILSQGLAGFVIGLSRGFFASSNLELGYPEPEWQEIGSSIRVIFWPHPLFKAYVESNVPVNAPVNVPANVPVNAPVNVPAKVPINDRQLWFLEALKQGKKLKSPDLAKQLAVNAKTSKRGIAFPSRTQPD